MLEGRRPLAKRSRIGWGLAVAAGAVAFAISTWTLREMQPRPMQFGRIEEWKPATEFLLKVSSSAVFDTLPALPQPVPDYSPVLTQEKGSRL